MALSTRFLFAAACSLAVALTAAGQRDEPSHSADPQAVPLWTKPDQDAQSAIGKAARELERGVFIVAAPEVGHGTAWTLSKEHRLLVTNAHVADIFHEAGGKMLAVPSGTDQVYRIERAWYHPGVRRYLASSDRSIRSSDPEDGPVDPQSPDLALLQLADGGPDLTTEFAPATADELASLLAQPAAIMGFPGHDNDGLPRLGETAAMTFHAGVISRVSDFELNGGAAPEERQFLQYTMATWGGFSGSPVILPSGHVAAVHNMARKVERKERSQAGEEVVDIVSFPHGVRVDCVYEMLVHHGLVDQAPFEIDLTKVNVKRWTDPDERTEQARADFDRANELARMAGDEVISDAYERAIELSEEAIETFPSCANAYLFRAYALNNLAAERGQIEPKTQILLLEEARKNILAYHALAPTDPKALTFGGMLRVNLGDATRDKSDLPEVIAEMTRLIDGVELEFGTKAEAYGTRGAAYLHANEPKAALADFNEAVRWNPLASSHFFNRASYWKLNGRQDLAAVDMKRAEAAAAETALKVKSVAEGGPAWTAGLRVGDVIASVSEMPIRTVEGLLHVLAQEDDQVVVSYRAADSGELKETKVKPVDGKIGVTLEVVEFKR